MSTDPRTWLSYIPVPPHLHWSCRRVLCETRRGNVGDGRCLRLVTNIVMAWNPVCTQRIFGGEYLPSSVIGPIEPTHLEHLNLRGFFRFSIEKYAEHLLLTAVRDRNKVCNTKRPTQLRTVKLSR